MKKEQSFEMKKMQKTTLASQRRITSMTEFEATLDRVRGRAIRMKSSEELGETTAFLFRSLQSFGFLPNDSVTYLTILDEANKTILVWMTRADGELIKQPRSITMARTDSFKKYFYSWKEQEPLLSRNYSGISLKSYLDFLSTFDYTQKDKSFRKLVDTHSKKLTATEASFLQGTIGVLAFEILPKESGQLLIRVARVMELIYSRFLDLQKSEAQAREVQIQAAFQRVRIKSMAMHKSEQLAETAKVLFEQFGLLGKIPDRMSIGIFNEVARRVGIVGHRSKWQQTQS